MYQQVPFHNEFIIFGIYPLVKDIITTVIIKVIKRETIIIAIRKCFISAIDRIIAGTTMIELITKSIRGKTQIVLMGIPKRHNQINKKLSFGKS